MLGVEREREREKIEKKYIDLIDRDIAKCQKKIDTIKEKYPEDCYGCRWMDKADKYDEQINILSRLKTTLKGHANSETEIAKLERQLFDCKTFIQDATRLLALYGERETAERGRRVFDAAKRTIYP